MARDLIQIYRGNKDNADPLAQGELFLGTSGSRNREIYIGGSGGEINITRMGETPLQYGAKGDDVTDDSQAFVDALADGVKTLVIAKPYVVTQDLDFTNVLLVFVNGGSINVDTGHILTITHIMAEPMHIFTGVGNVQFDKTVQHALPEWFGAKGDKAADYSSQIQKTHDSCITNGVNVLFTQKYTIGEKIEWSSSVPALALMGSTLEGFGGAVNCIDISDGNYYGKSVFPRIANFTGYGMKLKGTNVATLYCASITGCGDALILETVGATHANLLNTNIEIQQIGNCDRGVVFRADTTACVIQGNEILINFISTTKESVVFEDNGLIKSPGWDSNKVVLQAVDPTDVITDAIVLKNENTYAISRFTFKGESWIGGLAATAKYVSGKFNDLDCFMNVALAPKDLQIQVAGTRNILDFSDMDGSDASIELVATANQKGVFNGGVPLYRKKVNLKYTLPSDLLVGGSLNLYAYHQCTDGNTNNFMLTAGNVTGRGRGVTFDRVFDNSATNDDELLIVMQNNSSATIGSGTVIYMTLWQMVY